MFLLLTWSMQMFSDSMVRLQTQSYSKMISYVQREWSFIENLAICNNNLREVCCFLKAWTRLV